MTGSDAPWPPDLAAVGRSAHEAVGGPVHGFSVALSAQRDIAHVRLTGELDLATGHLFEPVVGQVLRLGLPQVRVDLARLGFCDVAGVRQLADACQRWHAHGLKVALRGARSPVRRVFALTGHGHLLASASTER
jgi:anti-anti-sigma factor